MDKQPNTAKNRNPETNLKKLTAKIEILAHP